MKDKLRALNQNIYNVSKAEKFLCIASKYFSIDWDHFGWVNNNNDHLPKLKIINSQSKNINHTIRLIYFTLKTKISTIEIDFDIPLNETFTGANGRCAGVPLRVKLEDLINSKILTV